jgi:methionine-rich copper-binding protein CopC
MNPTALARAVAATATAALLVAMTAAPVLAHAALVTSDPADGAVLDASPTTITLTFDDDLSAAKSSFKLTGPAATSVTSVTGAVTPGNIKVMTATDVALDPGSWTIEWTAFSTDGHLTRGTMKFTISAPTPLSTTAPMASPTAAASAAPVPTAAPTAAPTAVPTPVPSAAAPVDATGAADSGSVVIAAVGGLAIVAASAWLLFRRGRRS